MDSACAQCHTDLHIKSGELKYYQTHTRLR